MRHQKTLRVSDLKSEIMIWVARLWLKVTLGCNLHRLSRMQNTCLYFNFRYLYKFQYYYILFKTIHSCDVSHASSHMCAKVWRILRPINTIYIFERNLTIYTTNNQFSNKYIKIFIIVRCENVNCVVYYVSRYCTRALLWLWHTKEDTQTTGILWIVI